LRRLSHSRSIKQAGFERKEPGDELKGSGDEQKYLSDELKSLSVEIRETQLEIRVPAQENAEAGLRKINPWRANRTPARELREALRGIDKPAHGLARPT
jgi:hypothetical protein